MCKPAKHDVEPTPRQQGRSVFALDNRHIRDNIAEFVGLPHLGLARHRANPAEPLGGLSQQRQRQEACEYDYDDYYDYEHDYHRDDDGYIDDCNDYFYQSYF